MSKSIKIYKIKRLSCKSLDLHTITSIFVFSVNENELTKTISNYYGQNFDSHRYLNKFFDISIDLPKVNISNYMEYLEKSNSIFQIYVKKVSLFYYKIYLNRLNTGKSNIIHFFKNFFTSTYFIFNKKSNQKNSNSLSAKMQYLSDYFNYYITLIPEHRFRMYLTRSTCSLIT